MRGGQSPVVRHPRTQGAVARYPMIVIEEAEAQDTVRVIGKLQFLLRARTAVRNRTLYQAIGLSEEARLRVLAGTPTMA